MELRYDKKSPKVSKSVKNIGMVAGGSGIAPFLQLIRTICNDPNDHTKVSLIFANHVMQLELVLKQTWLFDFYFCFWI